MASRVCDLSIVDCHQREINRSPGVVLGVIGSVLCDLPISRVFLSRNIAPAPLEEELAFGLELIGDAHLTRHRLHRFLAWCIDSRIPELLTLATTVDTWWPAINAFVTPGSPIPAPRVTTGCSNRSNASRIQEPTAFNSPDTIPLHRTQRAATQTRPGCCPKKVEEPTKPLAKVGGVLSKMEVPNSGSRPARPRRSVPDSAREARHPLRRL